GAATSVAHSGANVIADSLSGDAGTAANVLSATVDAGDGGAGGEALPIAGPGGDATVTVTGLGGDLVVAPSAHGGSSVATAEANGGARGAGSLTASPWSGSGATGPPTAQGSAPNTADTGAALSTALSNP